MPIRGVVRSVAEGPVINPFLKALLAGVSLERNPRHPRRQVLFDRLVLLLQVWPYFYFNYVFSRKLPDHIGALVRIEDVVKFKEELMRLIQLHYIASILSFTPFSSAHQSIKKMHFNDMQYAYRVIHDQDGAQSPAELVERALASMLYYDVLYLWSTRPCCGRMVGFYNGKSFLYRVKEALVESAQIEF